MPRLGCRSSKLTASKYTGTVLCFLCAPRLAVELIDHDNEFSGWATKLVRLLETKLHLETVVRLAEVSRGFIPEAE